MQQSDEPPPPASAAGTQVKRRVARLPSLETLPGRWERRNLPGGYRCSTAEPSSRLASSEALWAPNGGVGWFALYYKALDLPKEERKRIGAATLWLICAGEGGMAAPSSGQSPTRALPLDPPKARMERFPIVSVELRGQFPFLPLNLLCQRPLP